MTAAAEIIATIHPSEWQARIDRLTRSNRRWRRVSALVCGVLVILGIMGAAAQKDGNQAQPRGDENNQQSNVDADDADLVPSYSNFCRVSATPEEVILDFGMNPQPFNAGPQKVRINQKLVMNYYTAKRFAAALVMTIQRHEKTFGPIELDVRKRVQNGKPNAEPGA